MEIVHPKEQPTLLLLEGVLAVEHIIIRVAFFLLLPLLGRVSPPVVPLHNRVVDHIPFGENAVSITPAALTSSLPFILPPFLALPIVLLLVLIVIVLLILDGPIIVVFSAFLLLLLHVMGTSVQGV